ncbi:MAG: hypothetical protein ABW022_07075 [Actinoplanes sp.]
MPVPASASAVPAGLPAALPVNGVMTPVSYGGSPSAAGAYVLHCLSQWHYIKSGVAGYLKPDGGSTTSAGVHADGDRNVDPWNLQFLPCWVEVEGQEFQRWAFWSNRSRGWLQPDWNRFSDFKVYATGPTAGDYSDAHWWVCSLDGWWTEIHWDLNGKYMGVRPNSGSRQVWATANSPGGSELFLIEPALPNIGRC